MNKKPRPRSDYDVPLVTDFSEGEEFTLGDEDCTVAEVIVKNQDAGVSYVMYECDDSDCLVGPNHMLLENQIRRWYMSGYLTKDVEGMNFRMGSGEIHLRDQHNMNNRPAAETTEVVLTLRYDFDADYDKEEMIEQALNRAEKAQRDEYEVIVG